MCKHFFFTIKIDIFVDRGKTQKERIIAVENERKFSKHLGKMPPVYEG